MPSLPLKIEAETLAVVLTKQLGQRLLGDGFLHLLAEMPLRLTERVSISATTTAASTAGFSAADQTTLTNQLTKRKAHKD